MKKFLMLVIVGVFAAAGFGAYTENFEDFSLGALVAQYSWEASAAIDVVSTSSSGEYVGGKALSPNNTGDKTTRHDATGVDFALTLDQAGIEYGFDMREDNTSAVSVVFYPRQGHTANYGPSVGLGGGSFTIRPNATSGDTFTGNWIGSGSLWEKGDWVRIWIRLTGENFANATVYCYNLTTGVMIPTGLEDVDMGVNIASKAASWTGFNFRLSQSTATYIDNAYITDIVPMMYVEDFEALSLGSINQAGWRDNFPSVNVITTSSDGEYVGGQAMKCGSTGDEWPQYAEDRSEDFGLNVGLFDGIEMGFDFREGLSGTTLTNCRMHFRKGLTAVYSPAFGLNGGAFAIRSVGEGGTTYTGNAIGSLGSGIWEKGDWLQVRLILRGDSYNYATMKAYNLTKSVDIPTGITNLNIGSNPQSSAADWDRLIFRMGSSTDTTVDNAYIADYVHDGLLAELPSPEDGAYPVSVDTPVVLSWLGAPSAASHKVYFGLSVDELTLETDTTDEYYELPYSLEKGTTYYWRVDEVVDGVDYEGIVWSFMTELDDLGYPRRLAYEGFDYTPYLQLSQGTNGSGGFGWNTSWERAEGGWCYVQVGPGSLLPAMDYLLGTSGNKVQHVAGGVDNGGMRELEYPIDMRADQDYYISYLAMADWDTYNSVSLSLWDSKNGSRFFGSHMYYNGYVSLTSPRFSLRDDTGNWTNRLFGSWTGGEVYVIVIKISASAAGDDTVYMSAFSQSNPLPETEPTVWDASFTTQSNAVLPWIEINGRASASDKWYVDEIHVGTGWGAATGWATACGDFGTIMAWDFNEDCQVDFEDYAVLAADWLRCTDPAIEGCEWVIEENDPNFASLFTALPAEQTNVYEASGITVDGDLSDWTGSRWYNTRFTSGFNFENASDIIEAKLALKWLPSSPDKVYLAVKVKDTNHSFAEAPTAWTSGENIEVRFTVNDTSTSVAWFPDTFDTAQYYQIFPLSPSGAYANLGGISTARDAGTYTDLEYAVSIDGDYILYEMAIPAYIAYNIGSQSGTKASLSDGNVIAFSIQINSVNGEVVGALFNSQGNNPSADWAKFTITANSSLELGDMGFFATDLDKSGIVGLSDLDFIISRWLSCTDPEIEGCDQPWLP